MGALGTGLGNLAYGAERARVEAYVDAHFDTLVHEIGAGGGATLDDAFAVAGVPETAQADFIQHMQGYDLSQPDNLVVALMVHRA
ncbi:MAG: hypothetical protein CR993_03765 [Rhodobacterales bacterium]|nr:MAG: hypothetical protein CR993_03765 [Rhodobacterales bacterium]